MKAKETVVKVEHSVTDYEKKIGEFLAEGMTTQQIADKEKISNRKMQFKIDKLRIKLGCSNVAELVAFFLRNKLID